MILPPEGWSEVWNIILEERQESQERGLAILFSTQEVETVCSLKLLAVALKARSVNYALLPVENVAQLRDTIGSLLADSVELRTVLLVNCGAGQWVRGMVPPSALNVRFVVVDSHRPVDPRYNNGDDLENVLVLAHDDPLPAAEVPPADAIDDLTDAGAARARAAARPAPRRAGGAARARRAPSRGARAAPAVRRGRDAAGAGARRGGGGRGGGGSDSPAKQARRADQGAVSRRHWRDRVREVKARQAAVAAYKEMGSSYGKPSPLVLQPLVECLCGRLDNTLLWPMCVGLTDQWIHQRLSNQHYQAWYKDLAARVVALECNRRHRGQAPGKLPPQSTAVVLPCTDYKLTLYRHWTLFDAFLYSPYVAARMQTWRGGGQDAVALLLARMGISTEAAKNGFESLRGEERRAFDEQLEAALKTTRLSFGELACHGFSMRHNRKTTQASDVVHAATALLSEYRAVDGDAGASAGFWAAAEAVDPSTVKGWDMLQAGVAMAKVVMQAIIQDGGVLTTDRKLTTNASAHYQELLLFSTHTPNSREFRHPLTLLRLAQFVRDATKVARLAVPYARPAPNYPILAVGPEDRHGNCLVVGLRASLLPGKAQYNIFGGVIAEALAEEGIAPDAARESFDRATAVLHRDQLAPFLMTLRRKMQEAATAAQEAVRLEQEAAAAAAAEGSPGAAPQQPGDGDAHGGGEQEAQPGGSEGESQGGDSSLAATDADSDDGDADVVAPSEDGEEPAETEAAPGRGAAESENDAMDGLPESLPGCSPRPHAQQAPQQQQQAQQTPRAPVRGRSCLGGGGVVLSRMAQLTADWPEGGALRLAAAKALLVAEQDAPAGDDAGEALVARLGRPTRVGGGLLQAAAHVLPDARYLAVARQVQQELQACWLAGLNLPRLGGSLVDGGLPPPGGGAASPPGPSAEELTAELLDVWGVAPKLTRLLSAAPAAGSSAPNPAPPARGAGRTARLACAAAEQPVNRPTATAGWDAPAVEAWAAAGGVEDAVVGALRRLAAHAHHLSSDCGGLLALTPAGGVDFGSHQVVVVGEGGGEGESARAGHASVERRLAVTNHSGHTVLLVNVCLAPECEWVSLSAAPEQGGSLPDVTLPLSSLRQQPAGDLPAVQLQPGASYTICLRLRTTSSQPRSQRELGVFSQLCLVTALAQSPCGAAEPAAAARATPAHATQPPGWRVAVGGLPVAGGLVGSAADLASVLRAEAKPFISAALRALFATPPSDAGAGFLFLAAPQDLTWPVAFARGQDPVAGAAGAAAAEQWRAFNGLEFAGGAVQLGQAPSYEAAAVGAVWRYGAMLASGRGAHTPGVQLPPLPVGGPPALASWQRLLVLEERACERAVASYAVYNTRLAVAVFPGGAASRRYAIVPPSELARPAHGDAQLLTYRGPLLSGLGVRLPRLAVISVPGLPEQRPALVTGDVVFLRLASKITPAARHALAAQLRGGGRGGPQGADGLALLGPLSASSQCALEVEAAGLVAAVDGSRCLLAMPDDFWALLGLLNDHDAARGRPGAWGKAPAAARSMLVHASFALDRTALGRMHAAIALAAASSRVLLPPGPATRALVAAGGVAPPDKQREVVALAAGLAMCGSVPLNAAQRLAVAAALCGGGIAAPLVLHGPPGTGKSATVCELVLQFRRVHPGARVLCCAPANYAADLLCAALAAAGVGAADMLRLNDWRRPVNQAKAEGRCGVLHHHRRAAAPAAGAPLRRADHRRARRRGREARPGGAGGRGGGAGPCSFDLVVVDEAGQALAPELLLPLGLAGPAAPVVLAGDPRQLGPVIRSGTAAAAGLGSSLLEEWIGLWRANCPQLAAAAADDGADGEPRGGLAPQPLTPAPGAAPPVPVSLCFTQLVDNYRSHARLLDLPSRLFYGGSLRACALEAAVAAPPWAELAPGGAREADDGGGGDDLADLAPSSMLFVGVNGQQAQDGDAPSYYNPQEVLVLAELLCSLLGTPARRGAAGGPARAAVSVNDVGVIATYRRQVQKIRGLLRQRGLGAGQEERIMFISTTLSKPESLPPPLPDVRARGGGGGGDPGSGGWALPPVGAADVGFWRNPKRFNVAITRAKALLVVVGSPRVLAADESWRQLLRHCVARGAYRGAGSSHLRALLRLGAEAPGEGLLGDGADDEAGLAAAVAAIADAAALGLGDAGRVYPATLDEYFAAAEEEQPWRVALNQRTKKALVNTRDACGALAAENRALLQQLEDSNREGYAAAEHFRAEVLRKNGRIAELGDQLEQLSADRDAHVAALEEQAAAREAALVAEREAVAGELGARVEALQAELDALADFRQHKARRAAESDAALSALREECAVLRGAMDAQGAELERHHAAAHSATRREYEQKLEELKRSQEAELEERLDAGVKRILAANRRLAEELRLHITESDALQGELKLLAADRGRVARELALKQELEAGWAARAGQQAAALKEAQARAAALEASLAQLLADFAQERAAVVARAQGQVTAAAGEVHALRRLLRLKGRELARLRRLGQEALLQRTEVETFLLSSLHQGALERAAAATTIACRGAAVQVRLAIELERAAGAPPREPQQGREEEQLKQQPQHAEPRQEHQEEPCASGSVPAPASCDGDDDGGGSGGSAAAAAAAVANAGVAGGHRRLSEEGAGPVDIRQLGWPDRERVLRLLFAKLNGRAADRGAAGLPPHARAAPAAPSACGAAAAAGVGGRAASCGSMPRRRVKIGSYGSSKADRRRGGRAEVERLTAELHSKLELLEQAQQHHAASRHEHDLLVGYCDALQWILEHMAAGQQQQSDDGDDDTSSEPCADPVRSGTSGSSGRSAPSEDEVALLEQLVRLPYSAAPPGTPAGRDSACAPGDAACAPGSEYEPGAAADDRVAPRHDPFRWWRWLLVQPRHPNIDTLTLEDACAAMDEVVRELSVSLVLLDGPCSGELAPLSRLKAALCRAMYLLMSATLSKRNELVPELCLTNRVTGEQATEHDLARYKAVVLGVRLSRDQVADMLAGLAAFNRLHAPLLEQVRELQTQLAAGGHDGARSSMLQHLERTTSDSAKLDRLVILSRKGALLRGMHGLTFFGTFTWRQLARVAVHSSPFTPNANVMAQAVVALVREGAL
ncbi:MOV10L1 [Scenedesmus sp. PABB004]|nr:MOV10L1 [Scenedesmus sp. PABB004]